MAELSWPTLVVLILVGGMAFVGQAMVMGGEYRPIWTTGILGVGGGLLLGALSSEGP